MTTRIHDDEPDTGEDVVRALLQAECPQWSGAALEYLQTSGTDNAMWRVATDGTPDVVVRLPRRPGAAAGVLQEVAVLQHIEQSLAFPTPTVRHIGKPHEVFPYHWSVLEWIDGTDAWTARNDTAMGSELVTDLAHAISSIGQTNGLDVARRPPGRRGGPLGPLLEQLDRWLSDPVWNATSLIDVAAVRRLAAVARELIDGPVVEGFVHGDLIPGNLLVHCGSLSAIIDWGGAGWGDLAQDLAPAWALFDGAERSAFREVMHVDEATWIRGRTFELEHAVGGVLYYVPKRHPLGDVMARTLGRILTSD